MVKSEACEEVYRVVIGSDMKGYVAPPVDAPETRLVYNRGIAGPDCSSCILNPRYQGGNERLSKIFQDCIAICTGADSDKAQQIGVAAEATLTLKAGNYSIHAIQQMSSQNLVPCRVFELCS